MKKLKDFTDVGLCIGHWDVFCICKCRKNYVHGLCYDSGVWTAVDVNCPGTGRNCTVQFVDEFGNPLSNVLDVYPIPSFKDKNGEDVEPLKIQ